jgi:hypothetical protein
LHNVLNMVDKMDVVVMVVPTNSLMRHGKKGRKRVQRRDNGKGVKMGVERR